MKYNDIIPNDLQHLSIIHLLDDIDFDNNFMIVSSTGSGKSILVPFIESMLKPDKRIYLRQPSRVSVHSLYASYKKFFGDRLEVGIMTSSLKENIDAGLVLVSDGILSNIFRRKSNLKDAIIYEDESHSLIGQTELELALIRAETNRRFDEDCEEPFVRILTATIDPNQLSDYLNIDSKDVHLLSKTNFNTNKYIIDADKIEFEDFLVNTFIPHLIENNRNGMVFVPTRANTQNYQIEYEKLIKTEFIHAGESPNKIEKVMEENRLNPEPLLIFSTIAGAMSITVNVDDVLILDEKVSSKMKEGVEYIIRVPCDDNLLIQMAGRVARFKEGDVYLYTRNHKSWDEIKPRPVELPLERTTPFDVSLIMAQYGVSDITKLELLSKINISELNYAMNYLKSRKVIENYEDSIQLTKLGKTVQKLPLDVKMAIVFANSGELMPIFASAFSSGYSNVWNFMSNQKTKTGWCKYPLNDKYYNGMSEFISKAKIIQDAFRVRSKGRGELAKWCNAYHFDYRYLGNVLGSFSTIENSMQKKLRDTLIDTDIDSVSKQFVDTIIKADVFPIVSFKRSRNGSLVGFHEGVYTILSSETERILYLTGEDNISVSGNIVQIKSKNGNIIRILSSGTVIG